ncbi:hypothetical protein F4806DRAFT_468550 [Annulohypoxylon nitens]|nr:hypothetical protein F4806DRAFT_468550 [Annulohypoxylon nitens]
MTDVPGSDRSLLDRLNALKPSTVNLDSPSKTIAASTIEPAKPPSREDALSERLKSLRNQSSSNNDSVRTTDGSGADDASGGTSTSFRLSQPQAGLNSGVSTPEGPSAKEEDDYNEDGFDEMNDEAIDELLADIRDDQEWIEEMLAEQEDQRIEEMIIEQERRGMEAMIAEREHQRVTGLLDALGKAPSNQDDTPETKTDREGSEEGSSDDDSEGNHMTREADDILARAVDEAEFEKANEPPSQPGPTPTSQTKDINPSHDKEPNKPTAPNDISPFNLPTVPSSLQDQPLPPTQDNTGEDDDDADFAASINSRMAALRVASPPRDLPSAPTTAVDAFGLPTAPTFQPSDRPLPGLIKRHGYTDADQKTWCTVCLEDGTVRCLGCDGDVYCARCWREMHVGPSAGYDERGHRWEKFDRGKG